mgnify:CR=1 FL=1
MSGYKKFGSDSPASADFVLSADKNLSNPTLHSVNDDAYAAKIADKMNLNRQIFYVHFGGFDTHGNQDQDH